MPSVADSKTGRIPLRPESQISNGAERARTADLYVANVPLSQLSYCPIGDPYCTMARAKAGDNISGLTTQRQAIRQGHEALRSLPPPNRRGGSRLSSPDLRSRRIAPPHGTTHPVQDPPLRLGMAGRCGVRTRRGIKVERLTKRDCHNCQKAACDRP